MLTVLPLARGERPIVANMAVRGVAPACRAAVLAVALLCLAQPTYTAPLRPASHVIRIPPKQQQTVFDCGAGGDLSDCDVVPTFTRFMHFHARYLSCYAPLRNGFNVNR